MLQIASGRYFRDVEIYETTHRATLYTNSQILAREPVELPIGRFLFATGLTAVTAVTIEVVDRLEGVDADGEPSFMKATGGTELIDDVADVFAFALNVTCSRNAPMMDRLVPANIDGRPTRMAQGNLRRTFDPAVLLSDDDLADAAAFASRLVSLRRDHFEAAMRSIRTVVDATLLVSDDPGLAYTLFVASLESLARLTVPPSQLRGWDTFDSARRKVIDGALEGVDEPIAARVRDAVLEIDQLSLRRRFIAFTLSHVEPSFYRSEAVTALRPVRAPDLPNALDVAYRLRSANVHELEALAPELWAISDRADTLLWNRRPVLGFEGMNRLCRHVIRTFVDRAPTDIDPTFDYRGHLPGIVRGLQLAPQLWIWSAGAFDLQSAARVLNGFIELLVEAMGKPDESHVVDMTSVLEKIEAMLPATATPASRAPLVAIYVLWNTVMAPELHRPRARELVDRFEPDLKDPSMPAFAARVLTASPVEWSNDELLRLVGTRRPELERGRGQPLPARLDAALLLEGASRLWDHGRVDAARALVSEAVELVPGDTGLMGLEDAATRGLKPLVDLLGFVIAPHRPPDEGPEVLSGDQSEVE